MDDISRALIDGCNGDMVCTFPDCLDSLQGTDVNIELVSSSTLRPYRLFFIHNLVSRTVGLIFVQTHLKDIVWKGTEDGEIAKEESERYTAEELGEKVKSQLENEELLRI